VKGAAPRCSNCLEPETLSGPAIAVSAIAFQRPAVIVSSLSYLSPFGAALTLIVAPQFGAIGSTHHRPRRSVSVISCLRSASSGSELDDATGWDKNARAGLLHVPFPAAFDTA